MWVKNDQKPEENGYYLTYYYNSEKNAYFYKAFVWNGKKWCFPRFDPDVMCWWNVKHDYYVPCQMQEGVSAIPEEFCR